MHRHYDKLLKFISCKVYGRPIEKPTEGNTSANKAAFARPLLCVHNVAAGRPAKKASRKYVDNMKP
jgi:hypothetical protein